MKTVAFKGELLLIRALRELAFLRAFFAQERRQHQQEVEAHKKEQKRLEALLAAAQADAHSDYLTGLLNRRAFDDYVAGAFARAERHEKSFAILSIDADGFKAINDNYGHDVGDAGIKMMADVLRGSLREHNDIIARIGGDEFMVLLQDVESIKKLMRVAERVVDAMHECDTFPCENVTFSVGISVYSYEVYRECRYADAAIMIKASDSALYAAKNAGRNGYAIHFGGGNFFSSREVDAFLKYK